MKMKFCILCIACIAVFSGCEYAHYKQIGSNYYPSYQIFNINDDVRVFTNIDIPTKRIGCPIIFSIIKNTKLPFISVGAWYEPLKKPDMVILHSYRIAVNGEEKIFKEIDFKFKNSNDKFRQDLNIDFEIGDVVDMIIDVTVKNKGKIERKKFTFRREVCRYFYFFLTLY